MAKILDKPFDPSKKIIRSIFKGSPNLITSSDLNRQIEAIKYEAVSLGKLTCVVSDFSIEKTLTEGTLTVNFDYSYIKFMGSLFFPEKNSININLTVSAPTAYLCLVADEETLTYETDFTHEIAGAKFADETSMPAANQLVYTNEEIILTHSLSATENLVAVIAVIELGDNKELTLYKNFIPQDDTLLLYTQRELISIYNEIIKSIPHIIYPVGSSTFAEGSASFSFQHTEQLKEGYIIELVIPYMKMKDTGDTTDVFQFSVKIPLEQTLQGESGWVPIVGNDNMSVTLRYAVRGTFSGGVFNIYLNVANRITEVKGAYFTVTKVMN